MASIVRLASQERARIEGAQAAATPTVTSAPVDASSTELDPFAQLSAMISGEAAPAPPAPSVAPAVEDAPAPVSATDVAAPEGATLAPPQTSQPAAEQASPVATVATPERKTGFLKAVQEDSGSRVSRSRASQDYLNILRSLAPIFRAATIYPGYDAAPEHVSTAVRKMSIVSVGLAEVIADSGDQLELDKAWAVKMLHDFTAELVATHWISTVIGKGGVVPGNSPDISVEYFVPAIKAAMAATPQVSAVTQYTDQTLIGGASLSLLKALVPLSVEIERFVGFVSQHVPDLPVSADAVIEEIGEFVTRQAMKYQGDFVDEHPGVSEDDRRLLMQALIAHTASVMLSAWEACRGEVLAELKDVTTEAEAKTLLTRDGFKSGFPLARLKARAEASLRRLVGTTRFSLNLLAQQAAGRGKGA
ncbi:hypothetical protein [Burkholderia contaminans]|uniref:Uncharacterized protein n=1 Tax=Burkholderia contaminans TaxID=488447 RepID=A0A2S5DM92_9BURK|nr:hypothetical protein [Burkholderia contaminans]POZ80198.1 hypothetical protein C3743_40175 [Burkholderia contaminans]